MKAAHTLNKISLFLIFLVESTILLQAQSASLTWTDNSDNEQGFNIERSENGTGFSIIATTAANQTAFTDSTIAPNIDYTYRVSAFNSYGESNYTNTVNYVLENTAPYISPIADLSQEEGTDFEIVAFTVSDPETDASGLTLSATSTNESLISSSTLAIVSYGSGQYGLSLSPLPGATGATTLEIEASDGLASSFLSFNVTVTPAAAIEFSIASVEAVASGAIRAGDPIRANVALSNATSLSQIDFYVDGEWQASTSQSPYEGLFIVEQPGDYLLTAIATLNNGSDPLTASCPITVLPIALSQTLIDSLQSVDIGSSVDSGSTVFDTSIDSVLISDTEGAFGNRNDSNRFAYLPVAGDFSLTARLAALDTNAPSALAGLMLRSSVDPNANRVAAVLDPQGIAAVTYREGKNSKTTNLTLTDLGPEFAYLRLARSGADTTLAVSIDGQTWFDILSGAFDIGDACLVGLAVAAGSDSGSQAVAVFDSLVFEGTISQDPAGTEPATGGSNGKGGGKPNKN